MSFGDAVHTSPSEAAHATCPESSKIKQCEDCPSFASIASPGTPANPSVLGFRWNTDQDTLIVSRGTTPDLIGKTITQRLVLSTVSSVFDSIRTNCSVRHKSPSTLETTLEEHRSTMGRKKSRRFTIKVPGMVF